MHRPVRDEPAERRAFAVGYGSKRRISALPTSASSSTSDSQIRAERYSSARCLDCSMQTSLEDGSRWQLGQVLRDVNPACIQVEVLHGLALLPGTQDHAKGSLLRRLSLVAIEPPQVELHLTKVRRPEVVQLQLNRHQSLHPPVKEQQIEVVVVAIENDSLLTPDEPEPSSRRKRSISRKIADSRSFSL